jgi:hypothetical protein
MKKNAHRELDERNHGNIFAWLGAPDPVTTQKLLAANYAPGTGEWFLKTNEYTEWKTGQNSIMLLSGPCKLIQSHTTTRVSPFLRWLWKDLSRVRRKYLDLNISHYFLAIL